MKFHFTTTPLKDVPLGTIVDGYKIDVRSHTGVNAQGWRIHNGQHERVLLIYNDKEPIKEIKA